MAITTIQKRFIYVICGVVLLALGAYALLHLDGGYLPQGGREILLYYYNPSLDQDEGGVACSDKGLVAVARTIPPNKNALREAIRMLIDGRLTAEERDQGITTEFPLEEFSLISADIRDGTAVLTFLDPKNKTSGGSCRVSILRAQLEATAKQFPHVRDVRIEPDYLFQP